MIVYHSPSSRSTRVVWALEEACAPYRAVVLTEEERRGPEHRRRHPLGRVPVVELDDGTTMFESAAICLTVGDLFPGSGLVPALGTPGRPPVLQWVLFAMTEVERTIVDWRRARREERDETEQRERFGALASVVASAVRQGPWLAGDAFTVADIVMTRVLNMARDELRDPQLEGYVRSALARPAHLRADALGRDMPEALRPV